MKKIQFLLFFLLGTLLSMPYLAAQNDIITSKFNSPFSQSLDLRKGDDQADDVVGSPYLQKDWNFSKVTSNEGEETEVKMKYDAFNDQMNVLQDEGVFILDDLYINTAIIGLKTFKKYPQPEGETGTRKLAFYEVLAEGEVTLLKRYKAKLIKGAAASAYGKATPDKLKMEDALYYLSDDMDRPIKLKKGKKNVLEVLKKKTSRIKSFAKKEKLSFRKEADLARIFEQYNTYFDEKE